MINKVKKIIVEIVEDSDLRIENITDSANIVEDIGLDSLQLINFMLRIEDEFGIEIDYDDLDMQCLSSVPAFCDYIKECKDGEIR